MSYLVLHFVVLLIIRRNTMKVSIKTENVNVSIENQDGDAIYSTTVKSVHTRVDVVKLIEAAGSLGEKIEKIITKVMEEAAE
jgi:hypothetical protein